MKTKLIALILVLAVVASACASGANQPVPGSWDRRVFTSEHMGFRVELLPGWAAATDREMAALTGELAEEAGSTLQQRAMQNVTHDMVAANPGTGANIQIIYERLGSRAARQLSTFDYMELQIDSMRAEGGTNIVMSEDTVRIGAHDWGYLDSTMRMHGVTIHIRTFVTIYEGFGVAIMVMYTNTSESIEEIMSMFGPL